MKKQIQISVLIMLLIVINNSCQKYENLGRAEIDENLTYKSKDFYFPHDSSFNYEFMIENRYDITKNGNIALITNNSNDGVTGHYITIKLNKKLDIIKAVYDESSDYIDGSKTIFKVDSVTLKLNKNPFDSERVIGYYKLFLTENYFANKLREIGAKDSITQRTFEGKFKSFD